MKKIYIYDTTLRDGGQSEEINFTTADKINITQQLDLLGVDYIEAGWPGSNPTDREYFEQIKHLNLQHSKIVAFGSTHFAKNTPENDNNLQSLIEAKADAITIFGKAWDIHVKTLSITPERNLELITNSLSYLRGHTKELFFDAEHFFDGFKANQEYTMACIKTAAKANIDAVVLCDTNGGTTPQEIEKIIKFVRQELPATKIGIHVHNDCDLAVANTLQAVDAGAVQVQGTINGYGERCGNANLTSIIPCLALKFGYNVLADPSKLALLTQISRFVADTANIQPLGRQPFTGKSAFAHKSGIHVSAVIKNSLTYEHVNPHLVGNKQRILLSDLAGRSNILSKAKQFGIELEKNDPILIKLLEQLKEREQKGFSYATAEASFEILLNNIFGKVRKFFQLKFLRISDVINENNNELMSEATIMVSVAGKEEHTASLGDGPVNAMDKALRKALTHFYPNLHEMELTDYKVRVLGQTEQAGTSAPVRVLIESKDHKQRWTTVGVSYNIIEASRQALIDSIIYKLFKDEKK